MPNEKRTPTKNEVTEAQAFNNALESLSDGRPCLGALFSEKGLILTANKMSQNAMVMLISSISKLILERNGINPEEPVTIPSLSKIGEVSNAIN